jgi:hypothetical protein
MEADVISGMSSSAITKSTRVAIGCFSGGLLHRITATVNVFEASRVPNLLLAYIIAKFAQTQTVIQSNKDKIVKFDIFLAVDG